MARASTGSAHAAGGGRRTGAPIAGNGLARTDRPHRLERTGLTQGLAEIEANAASRRVPRSGNSAYFSGGAAGAGGGVRAGRGVRGVAGEPERADGPGSGDGG